MDIKFQEHIIIKVRTVKEIFSDPEPGLDLDLLRSESGLGELEDILTSQYPRFAAKQVTFEVTDLSAHDENKIIRAIRAYCRHKVDSLTLQSRNTRRWGRRILRYALLGVAVLAALYLAVAKLQNSLPVLAGLIISFLTVTAWVIIWQPVELMLYDWREFKRDADIYSYISNLKINLKTTKSNK